MRTPKLLLNYFMIAGLAATLSACGDASQSSTNPDPALDEDTPAQREDALIGEVHTFAFEHDTAQADYEADLATKGMTLQADAPFVGVKIGLVSATPSLEYQIVYADGAQDDWQHFSPESSEDARTHRGFVNVAQPASEVRFRSVSSVDHLRVELFEEAVDTGWVDHGHDHIGDPISQESELSTREQSLNKPGRYQPSKAAMDAVRLGAFSYVGASPPCSGRMLEGTRDLGKFLVANFSGAYQYQGYNCRAIRGSSSMSMHGTGRAVDVFITQDRGKADNGLGDPVANYLIKHAAELGIQYFIWDRTQFNIRYGTKSYGGTHPHHDHLHIELTKHASKKRRSSFPATTSAPSIPEPPPFNPHFVDDDNSSHEAAINAIYEAGITRGCSGGPRPKFCPNDSVNRANLAVMFMRAFNLPHVSTDYFSDDNGSHAEGAINSLAYRGITSGCDGTGDKFCPQDDVTRSQLVRFIDRTLQLQDTTRDYFSDDNGTAYEDAANRLAAVGIFEGCGGGKLCPNDKITRGQLATVLARATGLISGHSAQPVNYVPHFADDDGSVHEDAINWIYEQGITSGCGKDGNRLLYCPRQDMTRGNMAAMMVRAFALPSTNADHFSDVDGISNEAAINALAEAGITGGCGGDKFCPSDALTLGQASAFLARAAQLPDASSMTQAEAIQALMAEKVIQRPGCAQNPQTCVGTVVNRAQVASLLYRVLHL